MSEQSGPREPRPPIEFVEQVNRACELSEFAIEQIRGYAADQDWYEVARLAMGLATAFDRLTEGAVLSAAYGKLAKQRKGKR